MPKCSSFFCGWSQEGKILHSLTYHHDNSKEPHFLPLLRTFENQHAKEAQVRLSPGLILSSAVPQGYEDQQVVWSCLKSRSSSVRRIQSLGISLSYQKPQKFRKNPKIQKFMGKFISMGRKIQLERGSGPCRNIFKPNFQK